MFSRRTNWHLAPNALTRAIEQVRASGKEILDLTVSNPTASDLPYGFGIHPYFRLPFPPGGDPGRQYFSCK